MKTSDPRLWLRWLLLAPASVLLLSPAARAQRTSATPDAATLAKYDTNKNGQLDAGELAAMQASQASAATTPVASSNNATASTSGDAVMMSPFEVKQGEDTGYYASSSLSGTRLNSKLEDLASSISVVTKQQLLDTAAVDINDIFLYEANTEGTGQFTNFTVGRNGEVNDGIQSDPMNSNRIRGIDAANISRDGFAADSRIPVDTYNLAGAEIARGANSNIFGLGNASGTLNMISSRANTEREVTNFTARVDSYEGFRSTLDINRPIFRNKLALRLSGVYDSKGFTRKPSADITRRAQAQLTYQPIRQTTIRVSYETYHNYARRPNSITPRDTTTFWNASGRPTWDPITQRVTRNGVQEATVYPQSADGNLPPGIMGSGTGFYVRPGFYVDRNGATGLYTVNRSANAPAAGATPSPGQANSNIRYLESSTDILRLRGSTMPLFTTPGISAKSLYDWEDINYVAPNYNQDKADIYQAAIEQMLINTTRHNLVARASWFREDLDSYGRNFIGGNSSVLFVDVNEKLLDGRANPYFLRPYLGASEPTVFNRPSVNDTAKFEAAYQLDLTQERDGFGNILRWLGRHRAAAYHETRLITRGTYRYREQIYSDHPWLSNTNRQSNAHARGYFKYYLGDNAGGGIDYAPPELYGLAGTYDFLWFNGATQQWVTEPVKFGEIGVTPSNRTKREVRSRGMTLQSFLVQERVVTTFGWRRDKNRSRDSAGATIDPTTGFLNYDALNTWGLFRENQGPTKTRGIVVKPFRNWGPIDRWADNSFAGDFVRSVSVYYNDADTFQPADAAFNNFGEQLPDPRGEGKDYGVNFSLFRGKLAVRVNKYVNTQILSRGGDAGIVAGRAHRLDFGNDGFNLEDIATGWVAALYPTATPTQQRAELYKIMQFEDGFIESLAGKSIAETQDISSKGYEIELNYNPTKNWTLRANVARQQTIDTNMSPNVQRYIDQRLPIWEKIRVPTVLRADGTPFPGAGSLWWETGYGNAGSARGFYEGSVIAPFKLAVANQGKPRSQTREWRFNASTRYNLVGLFPENRWLRTTSVGGSVRWEDKAAIGFLGAAPDADGVVRSLDKNKPVFDEARAAFDFFLSHNFRFHSGKIRGSVQLNVRNAFEGGRLQAVSVNPDGRASTFRIIDPRQFILTTSFDL